MTSKIQYKCISKGQKEAIGQILNYKKKSYLNNLINDVQQWGNVRRDRNYTDTMFDLDMYPDYIDLYKYIDYTTKEYVNERYKIYTNGYTEKMDY